MMEKENTYEKIKNILHRATIKRNDKKKSKQMKAKIVLKIQ